ncbi:MAG: tRNA 2-thiouridine(34) synthase MnmA [Alphaproteobacteria bacterium]|nr:tRNA 2-thiouridine(34) synthase MnmA [Alphaproteobacteria bacterium]
MRRFSERISALFDPALIDLPKGTRVAVAMSGGVDSSVTAALLKESGLDVVGVTMRLLGGLLPSASGCCGGPDMRDAKRVADFLKIPHHVLDFEQEFEDEVVRPFAAAYAMGETPSPCIECNRSLKFRHLLQTASELGAQALATGHYARRLKGAHGPELHMGADPTRDQSYFLFALSPQNLDRLRFPLGAISKSEVRAYAARLGLPVASKPDSQDICFVAENGYAELVGRYQPQSLTPGEIVDEQGCVLGRHKGLAHYTVGQRRGLGLGGGPPLYVLALDAGTGRLVVGPKGSLGRRNIILRDLYWLATERAEASLQAAFRIRSTRLPVQGTLSRGPNAAARVVLDEPEEGVAPGQACVVYLGSRVLGGGWIEKDGINP